MMAKVTPGYNYTWNRVYQDRSVTITKSADGKQWNVQSINSSKIPTGFPDPVPDCLLADLDDHINEPSEANVIYFYDNPGMTLKGFLACHKNDYAYEETNFTYSIVMRDGTLKETGTATFNVGQILCAKRVDMTGNYILDWIPIQNTVSSSNIPSCNNITIDKIREIVKGTLPIVIKDNTNSDNPNP